MDGRHRRDGVLRDQGSFVNGYSPAGRPRPAVLRRTRRAVLAGVRRQGQVGDHGQRRVAASVRTVAPQGCQQGGVVGSPPDGGAPGRRAGRSPAWNAGVSRADLRVAAVRAGPIGEGYGAARVDAQRGPAAALLLTTAGRHPAPPPADAPTKVPQILAPQGPRANPLFDFVAPKVAGLPFSGAFRAMYFPGIKFFVQRSG